jgi:RNA polymerase sigma factor (sigma-70 family)
MVLDGRPLSLWSVSESVRLGHGVSGMKHCRDLSDQELVQRTRPGDSVAFGELWARYKGKVLALCRRYLAGAHRDPAVDEHDLATETFIRALHGLDRYEDRTAAGTGFGAWLLEVAKRLCLKFLNRQRQRRQWTTVRAAELQPQSHATQGTEQLVQQRESLRLAAEAINALPERYRIAFKLFLEEQPQTEIAATLGISVESAAKRIQRARARLRWAATKRVWRYCSSA